MTSAAHQNDMRSGDEAETMKPSNISEDGAGSDSVVSGSGSESLQSTDRPNKYRGPPSTWRSWTEAERLLATSLDQERAADLAIHLYNSHALKRRLRQYNSTSLVHGWRSKERWYVPQGHPGTEAVGNGKDTFCPHKGWTAWPMKPELVPREGEGMSWSSGRVVKDNQDGGKMKDPKPSEILEDCIFGGMLKVAKEKRREGGRDHTQQDREDRSRLASGSGLHTAAVSSTKGRNYPTANNSTAIGGYEKRLSCSSADPEVSHYPYSELVPMADDEKAHNLLQPINCHLLSQLDSLLMGLHHARGAYLYSSDERGPKIAQKHHKIDLPPSLGRKRRPPTPENYIGPAKRGRGRPPRVFTKSANLVVQNDDLLDDSVPAAREQKRKFGRPRKYPKGFEKYQTYYMMHKLAEDPKTKSGSPLNLAGNESTSDYAIESESESSSSGTLETPPPSTRKRRVIGNPVTKARFKIKKQKQLGLRDWSDVLGVASMVGWEPEAVSRAAARCSTLFGEGINFRTLAEEETFLKNGRIVEYRPDVISG